MSKFITLIDENSRHSSLMVGEKSLIVVGVLNHGTKIRPLNNEDAQALIDWLIKEFPEIKLTK
jgi:hypothetical protein